MADLASKRNAKDLWISKGHVGAVAVLCLAMTLGGYALGYMNGRGDVTQGVSVSAELKPGRASVLELLDRIEGSTVDPADQQTLTFPHVLTGEESSEDSLDSTVPMPKVTTSVAAGKVKGPLVVVKEIRRGEMGLQIALRQMVLGKLVGRSVGETSQTVTISGFENLEEAQRHLEKLRLQYPDLEAVFEIRGQ